MVTSLSKPSGKIVDLTGNRYGFLTVAEYCGIVNHKAMWKCVCDCGNITIVKSNNLRTGTTTSCGCMRGHRPNQTLAKDHPRLYGVWAAMKRRCYNKSCARYKSYGGRGIKVCDEWQTFEPFFNWAMSNGYNEKAQYGDCTIDRIDVDGNYEPNNCRWVDMKTQASNKRQNKGGDKTS